MDRRRRSATVKKAVGTGNIRRRMRRASSKDRGGSVETISRADGNRRIQEFFASGALEGGMLSVPFKRLSLLCPITNKRIVDPARGVNCTHLECFDLLAYLDLQIKKPFWNCPVCQKRLPAEDLRMDEFMWCVLRRELDGVHVVEVSGDGSHRAVKQSESSRSNSNQQARPGDDDAITLDDEPMVIDNEDYEATESGPLVTLPLRLLLNFNSQSKDLISRLPVKKGKRKADDPADLIEQHLDALRNLIKQASATGTSHATRQSPEPVRNDALVNNELRAKNEELASRNSALLAENLRLNHRLAELERQHAKGRPNLRFIAATMKNTAEVLMWLDRFSLDAVQFTCRLLKDTVDVCLPVAPKRVLKSVVFDGWYCNCNVKLVPRENIEKKLHGEREVIFRRMLALCSGCAIEYFKVEMASCTPTIRAIFAENLPWLHVMKAHLVCPFGLSNALIQMMKGLERVYISWRIEGITDETMRICAERGVARLSVYNGDGVTDEAVLDFFFSNMPVNGNAAGRTFSMNHEASLSKNFFDKLKCLDQMPKPLPGVALGCVVDTASYDGMAKTHVYELWKCTHFQLAASGEKFEIIVRKVIYGGQDYLVVRKGHADIGNATHGNTLVNGMDKKCIFDLLLLLLSRNTC